MTTYRGTVTAASEWGGVAERKRVRPAREGSYEALFHAALPARFLLDLHGPVANALERERLERAIWVLYLPATERVSHYFGAVLPRQFHIVLHFDETQALEPLERTSGWERGELPETFPSAI